MNTSTGMRAVLTIFDGVTEGSESLGIAKFDCNIFTLSSRSQRKELGSTQNSVYLDDSWGIQSEALTSSYNKAIRTSWNVKKWAAGIQNWLCKSIISLGQRHTFPKQACDLQASE